MKKQKIEEPKGGNVNSSKWCDKYSLIKTGGADMSERTGRGRAI